MNSEQKGIQLKELEKFISEPGVSRRDFLKRAAVLGVTVSAASTLWTEKVEAAPQKGGHMRIGSEGGATTDSYDPRHAIGTNMVTTGLNATYDRLMEFGPDGPKHMLAESHEGSNGAKTWRFKLRKGVEFHNGKTVTTEDVIASMHYAAHEDSGFAEGKNTMAEVEELTADGDYIVFNLKAPNADFAYGPALWAFQIGPAGTTKQEWDKAGYGSGAYIIENSEPGVRLSGKRNPNYWNDGVDGWVDSFEIINIADPASRTNAIKTEAVDFVSRPDEKTANRLGNSDNVELMIAEGNQHYTMPMRTDVDPFTDNNVRLAMKHLIDREQMLQKVLSGFGYVGNDVPIGKGQQYFNDQIPQRQYDPEKAKFYLNKSGISSLDVELSAADAAFSGGVDAAVLMAESAKAAGVNINVKKVPNDGYWSETWLKAPWCLCYWSGRPTINQMVTSAYVSTSSWNDTYWKNDRLDSLIEMARGELDQAKRKDMYFEVQELIHNESGTIIPVFASFIHAAGPKFGHAGLRGNWSLDNHMLTRTGWIKS